MSSLRTKSPASARPRSISVDRDTEPDHDLRRELVDARARQRGGVRRGFLDEAKLDFTTYAAASEQLAQTPLRRIAVTWLKGEQVEGLAALPVAPTLTGLVLRDPQLTDVAVTALVAAPLLGGLVELVLQRVAFTACTRMTT